MKRRTLVNRTAASAACLALPAWARQRGIAIGQSAAFAGPAAQIDIQMNAGAKIYFDALNANRGVSSRDHVASRFVDLSMLTGDGRVRR